MNSRFADRVRLIVKNIKKGETMTYKQVAIACGSMGAARAVGNIMKKNTDKEIPCHRVVRSDGKSSPYNGLQGSSREDLLKKEGAWK